VLRYGDGERVEPLHAVYRRTCLPAMEAAIRAGRRRVISFFPHVRVRYVTTEDVTPFDPDLRSFRNVNTPQEWEAARVAWRQEGLDDVFDEEHPDARHNHPPWPSPASRRRN